MRLYFLVLLAGFHILMGGISLIHAQEVSSDVIEVIVGGKRYESIFVYQREQVKNAIVNVLATYDLQMFTEEELLDIINKARNQKSADASPIESNKPHHVQSDTQKQDQQNSEEDTLDPDFSQMQGMLKDYLHKHKDADPVFLDPNKVKNIIIEPKTKSGAGLSN